MISSFVIRNYLGEELTIELRSPEKSGFLVRGIEGLGAPKATVNFTQAIFLDGGVFNNARVASRNITFDFAFYELPDKTIEDLRVQSYRMFPIKSLVTVTFETSTGTRQISGYVESNEQDIFTDQAGCQISLLCDNQPYFMLPEVSIVKFSEMSGGFEFPFFDNFGDGNSLSFMDVAPSTMRNIQYDGTVSTGFNLYAAISGNVSDLRIYDLRARKHLELSASVLEMLTGESLKAGDALEISTHRGNKFITLLRNGVRINVLSAMTEDSDWLTLEKGENPYYYEANDGTGNIQMRLEFPTLYEGI